jgi:hypothetical protein
VADAKISALTANAAPAGTDQFATNQSGTSVRTTLQQCSTFANTDPTFDVLVVLDAAYTLTSTTSAQKLFNASTNGAVTLATGWYIFDSVIGITGLSASSGNGQFQILGGGTAVLGGVVYSTVGVDGASATAATQTGSWSVASSSAASVLTAGTATAMMMNTRGTFEVTTTGTIIPSIALVTAAAGSVVVGSYFRARRIGASGGNVTQGTWT